MLVTFSHYDKILKILEINNWKKESLFSLMVLEVSVTVIWFCVLGPVMRYNMVEGCDGGKLLISWQPGSRKSKRTRELMQPPRAYIQSPSTSN
jgi:hypothetical protein